MNATKMSLANAIVVWRWEEAPEEFRALSPFGGDEDWVAFVPEPLIEEYIPWLNVGCFGFADVSEHRVPGGVVYIGAHS